MSGGLSTALSSASGASVAVVMCASWPRACFSIPRIMGLSSTSSTVALCGILGFLRSGSGAPVIAALAAGLRSQDYLANLNALVEGFAHVVDGEGGNAGGHQRFHLPPGFGASRGPGGNPDAIFAHGDIDSNVRQDNGVAQGDELGS